MVLVVDQTLVMVSFSHGAEPASSTVPPQMSTTGSPCSRTATEAPTSVPASRLSDSVVATPSNLGSQVPWMSAIVSSLPRPVLRTRLFHGRTVGTASPPVAPGDGRSRRNRSRNRPEVRVPAPCRDHPVDPLPLYPVSDASDTQLTRDTYERLQAELEDLTTRGRVEIAALIEAARALGDLKENGDYHAAKDSQGKMESRIRQLEQMLKNATVVDGRAPSDGTVAHGSVVTLRYEGDDEDDTADYFVGSIEERQGDLTVVSPGSPLGQALIGHAVGETVEYAAPGGNLRVEIVKIGA